MYGSIYKYLGFTYVLDYDEDPDDLTRKNVHLVLDHNNKQIPWKDVPDWGAYSEPTYEEFKKFIIDYVSRGAEQPEMTEEIDKFYTNIEQERGNI
tara:strand:- start:138 stop:422 length:285 start_codon:yes stop_codon:yes gene_type:complete